MRAAALASAALVLLAVLAGCAEEPILSPPVRAEAASVVVAFIDPQGAVRDPTAQHAAGPWSVRIERADAAQVVVLYYDLPLDALDLSVGPVAAGPEAPCARLAPAESWRAPSPEGPFTRAPIPPELADILVPRGETRCGRCRAFTEVHLEIPGRRGRLEGAAPLSDGTALVLGDPGQVLVVDRVTGVDTLTGCPPERYETLAPYGVDHFFFGTVDGRVHQVEIDPRLRTCRVIAERTTTTTRSMEWLAASPDGHEVFGLDVAGRLHRAIGSGPLEQVFEASINDLKFSREGGISRAGLDWLAPGEVVVSGSYPHAQWWSNGRVRRTEAVETRLHGDSVSEIEVIGEDVYVGDGGGQVIRFRPDGEQGVAIPGSPLAEIVGSIVPDKDGLIVTTGSGVVGSYYPPFGWCPIHQIAGTSDRGRHVFFQPDGALLIGDMVGDQNSPAQVVWLLGR